MHTPQLHKSLLLCILYNSRTPRLLTLLSCLALLTACGGDGGSASDVEGSKDYISARDVEIPGNNTQATLQISANCNWTIREDIEWLSVNPSQGSRNQNVTITTTGINPSATSERSGTLIIGSAGGAEHRITVTQLKASEVLRVNVSTLNFTSEKSFKDIAITANNHWSITGQTDWLYLDRNEGTGNATVRVNVEANEKTAARTPAELVIVSDGGLRATISVTQAGSDITVSLNVTPGSIAAPAAGGVYQLNVSGNAEWKATLPAGVSWLRLSQSSGTGNAQLQVTVDKNDSQAERVAVISIASGDIIATCTVTQAFEAEGNKPDEGDNPLPGM